VEKTQEGIRLEESRHRKVHWKRWGPYLSERQWGTVREDYSPGGAAWEYFPHDHARSRAYRWGEDGIAGICDRHQILCFALALWNGRDPILKERLFGLTGNEGNHGEDVKEYYYYLDSTPTHSYMKCLYKYPQAEFPYAWLVEENKRRGRDQPEFELIDTGIFDGNRYFDVFVEYAKEDLDDIAIRITAWNRGPEAADLHLLPHLWYRNRWSWGGIGEQPGLEAELQAESRSVVAIEGTQYGKRWLVCENHPELLFTNNETNTERLYNTPNRTPYVKDAFHRYLIHGETGAVNPERVGTKCAALYKRTIPAGGSVELRLRLTHKQPTEDMLGEEYESVLARRMAESEEFYHHRVPAESSADLRTVQRQAFAGMLWSKQFYHYDVGLWLDGDAGQPPPPEERKTGRNAEWRHLNNSDVVSMPDKWEYPWYAAWDLAFHTVTLALVDPDFAKEQLVLMLREWYMHPSGQLPAYEWAFSDVNPPVHAWAAWRVYKIEKRVRGKADFSFLARVFHKLLLNFTWWVNRKDFEGKNVFQGGFLGLDNIGVFDRSKPLPTGGFLEQSDGTSWMAMYCLNMLAIALELARVNKDYEDVASKFFEHFVRISQAMNNLGGEGIDLWDPVDGFYYDVLHLPNGAHYPLRIRSMVGLIPLFAVETLEPDMIAKLPGFTRRMNWFIDNVPGVRDRVDITETAKGTRRLLSLVNRDKLARVMGYLLDPEEFLAPHGVRALSKFHKRAPYVLEVDGVEHRVDYEPGESSTSLFGGNSNWRGPIWFPLNFLLIESLQKFHYYFGDSFQTNGATLWDSAAEISRRLNHIFLMQDDRRPVNGDVPIFDNDPYWRDLVCFYEYFHGDNGRGVGASHQTGWTGLVAKLLEQSGE
jgi:hypothetical protein